MQIGDLFTCQMCDECCYGQETICLSPTDISRMAEGMGLTEKEFLTEYCVIKQGRVQMKVVADHCIFWNGRCSIHDFKPDRCREWPFVPSLIEKSSFITIQQNCPGFNKNVTFEEALPILKKVLSSEC